MQKKTPQIEILRREHQLLQEDLKAHYSHHQRLVGAAEKIAKAIQYLAKPSSDTQTRRS